MDKEMIDRINNLMSELKDIKQKLDNKSTNDKKGDCKSDKEKRIDMALELIKQYLQ